MSAGGTSAARRLAFALVPVTALLAGGEGVARLVGEPPQSLRDHVGGDDAALPGWMRVDPGLGWALQPGAQIGDPVYSAEAERYGWPDPPAGEVPVNPRGWRDDPVTDPRPPDELRVYAMGDSSVWGSGVPFVETFSQRLERALPERLGQPVAVYNAGVSGYSSFQALAALERNLDVQPDVVVAYLMNSDLMEFRGSPDSVWFNRPVARQNLSLLTASAALRWLHWWRVCYFPLRRAADGKLLRVRVQDFRDNLDRLLDLSRDHGFEVVFVIPPMDSDLRHAGESRAHLPVGDDLQPLRDELAEAEAADHWTGQERRHFRMAMLLAARDAGARLVDGPRLFASRAAAEPERFRGEGHLFADPIHPSREGHALLAEALLEPVAAALAPQGAPPGG